MPSSAEAAPVIPDGREWRARLKLDYARRNNRTVLAQRAHYGPLTVQKPFYPEGDVCHSYILHPPGGMAPGDRLSIDVTAAPGAATLLTTPAAGKCYRSDGRLTTLDQTVRVGGRACLEWLPQENILFEGCNAALSTRVELEADAAFIGWELLCLGRPAAGERFRNGAVRQRFELSRAGRPLLIERSDFEGGHAVLDAPWGLGGHTVLGTLVAVGVDAGLFKTIQQHNDHTASALAAATLIDDVLICRYLGTNIESARNGFIDIWRQLRPRLLNRRAVAPRIWST